LAWILQLLSTEAVIGKRQVHRSTVNREFTDHRFVYGVLLGALALKLLLLRAEAVIGERQSNPPR
jgi:hypothetical protein